MIEGETNEQAGRSTEGPLRENVLGHTPVLLEHSVSYNHDLRGQWHSKFAKLFFAWFVVSGSVTGLFVQLVNLSLNILCLLTILPNFVPVRSLSRRSSVDDLEHEFSRVLVILTVSSSIGLEVVKKCSGVLSDITEVDSLTALCQEEKAIEFLEKNSAGLMDGTENSLAGVGELAEEGADGPGTLRVQSTLSNVSTSFHTGH